MSYHLNIQDNDNQYDDEVEAFREDFGNRDEAARLKEIVRRIKEGFAGYPESEWPEMRRLRDEEVAARREAAARNAPEGEPEPAPAAAASECSEPNDLDDNDTPAPGGDDRPHIAVQAGRLPEIVDVAEECLLRMGGVYQRSERLVRIGELVLPKRRPTLAPIEITVENLVDILTQRFYWSKYDGRRKEDVACNCPREIAATLLARTGQWKLPALHAVITAPTLRADGSILDQPGFDSETGIYLEPQGVCYPPIPLHPTREDALEALNELTDLVREVPFVEHDEHGAVNRSVFLSAFLTALIRCSLPYAPLHAFDAPDAGSGKTMLTAAVSYAATGEPGSVSSQGATEEEMEKRLATVLRAGDAVIVFDNCTAPIEGDLLCQAVTSPILNLRILGKTERVRVVNSAIYMATGNNLVVIGDMIRRTLRATIDPKVESPESRTFTTERPDDLVAQNRAHYVLAGLTVLRAFHVAGRPPQARSGEGFDGWTGWVRNALIWLGEPDPWLATTQTRQEDPERQKIASVLREWYEGFPDQRLRVQALMDRALAMVETGDPARPRRFSNEALKEALVAVADDGGGKISKQKLSKWLTQQKNRIIDGFQLRSTTLDGYANWAVHLVQNETP